MWNIDTIIHNIHASLEFTEKTESRQNNSLVFPQVNNLESEEEVKILYLYRIDLRRFLCGFLKSYFGESENIICVSKIKLSESKPQKIKS